MNHRTHHAARGLVGALTLALTAGALLATPQTVQSGPISSPVRIAHNAGLGRVVVSDGGTRRIRILDEALQPVSSFAVGGKPIGVATYGSYILVGNGSTGRIELYDYQGTKLGEDSQVYLKPNDIAIASNHNKPVMAVADTGAKLVKITPLHSGGPVTYASRLPAGGPDPQVLAMPTAVAIDVANGEFLVSDFGDAGLGIDARVQIFGFDGTLHATLSGAFSWFSNDFSRPQGLATHNGRIYLVDSWIGTVLVYDRATLQLIDRFGTYGAQPGELSLPLSVAIDAGSGDLYVTNNLNRRIELFTGGAQ